MTASFDGHPALLGRHVYLRPVMPGDYGLIQAMETSGPHATRWRFRGETPSPDRWAQTLWTGVWAQHLVVRGADDMPLGLVFAYRASQLDRHCYFAALSFSAGREPLMTFGVALFLDYLFQAGNFRVAYAEVPAYNLDQFGSAIGRYCDVEGQLRDYVLWEGRYWDMYVLAFRPERFTREGVLRYARQSDADEADATDEIVPGLPRRIVFRA